MKINVCILSVKDKWTTFNAHTFDVHTLNAHSIFGCNLQFPTWRNLERGACY